MDAKSIEKVLIDTARDEVEEISLSFLLIDMVDLSELADKLDFDFGVAPPREALEEMTGQELVEFYQG